MMVVVVFLLSKLPWEFIGFRDVLNTSFYMDVVIENWHRFYLLLLDVGELGILGLNGIPRTTKKKSQGVVKSKREREMNKIGKMG